MAAALPQLRRDRRSWRPSTVLGVALGNGWYRGRLAWHGKSGLYGDELGLLRPAGHRVRRRPRPVRRLRHVLAGRALGAPRPTTSTTGRPSTPAGTGTAGRGQASTPARRWRRLGRGARAGVRRRPAGRAASGRRWCGTRSLKPVRDLDLARPARRWWTSARTWSAGCGSPSRARPGTTITVRHAEVLEHGELGTRPLRSAAGHRHVHPVRRRGLLRAHHHLPRLPLRRGRRLARRR